MVTSAGQVSAGGTYLNTGPGFYFNRYDTAPISMGRPAVEMSYRVRYNRVLGSTRQAVVIENTISQGQWGTRDSLWAASGWVANSGLAAGQATRRRIQADLDDLAVPRTYHDVTLPLWQTTVARRNTIAGLDYGSYLDLGLVDGRQGVNISDKVVVAERTVSWAHGKCPPSASDACTRERLVLLHL